MKQSHSTTENENAIGTSGVIVPMQRSRSTARNSSRSLRIYVYAKRVLGAHSADHGTCHVGVAHQGSLQHSHIRSPDLETQLQHSSRRRATCHHSTCSSLVEPSCLSDVTPAGRHAAQTWSDQPELQTTLSTHSAHKRVLAQTQIASTSHVEATPKATQPGRGASPRGVNSEV